MSLSSASVVLARAHDGHCFGGMGCWEGPGANHFTTSQEIASREREEIETRTRKVDNGFAWSDSVTNMPKASTFICSVSKKDDCGIVVSNWSAAWCERRMGVRPDKKWNL